MRARGLASLRQLFAQRLVYVDPATAEFSVPEPEHPEACAAFREDWATIAAVLRRARAFTLLLKIPSADPFLRMPGVRADLCRCRACGSPSRLCQSCAAPLRKDGLRCEHCELAAELALAAAEVVAIPEEARRRRRPGPGSPPSPWRCPRCGTITLTREAGARCPTCGFREGAT